MKEPLYEMEVKTAYCFIEILINDVPIFSNYSENGLAVDYPINDLILESGNHNIKVSILTPILGQNISKHAKCEINIFVKEANGIATGRTLVKKFPAIKMEKNLSSFLSKQTNFEVKVPYQNFGWKNSIDLKNIDNNLLLEELKRNVKYLQSIYNSRNESQYVDYFIDRNKEHIKSFYLTKEEISDNKDTIFYGLPEKIDSIDLNLYELTFFGNGKLVSLQTTKQPPGFVFESTNRNEYGFTEMVLFHKRDKNSKLEVIR